MEIRRRSYRSSSSILIFLFLLHLQSVFCNLVFEVGHKYRSRNGRDGTPIGALRLHDSRRHRRMLTAIDFPLGGDGSPTGTALYYTKIGIGTPAADYYVQVDTGSDIMWVYCKYCENCPQKSDLSIPLRQYDISASSSGKLVTCDQDFCDVAFSGPNSNCQEGMNCEYSVTYGDGSRSEGHFVKDLIRFDQVTENFQTSPLNGSFAFGCSSKQMGELGSSSEAVDGIIGFGQANTSLLSQLALSGRVKKVFSHCLDGNSGGGIFAIGDVVQPKVNTTPLIRDQQHYNVNLRSIDVDGQLLNLPTDLFDTGSGGGTIIDSGTTLAYLPSLVYQQFMNRIRAHQPYLETYIVERQFTCFRFTGAVDDGFPVVTFHFQNSLSLAVHPHDYLFEVRDTEYCIGWQNSGLQTKDGSQLTLLGDIVLQNKLVVYDLENQAIGWTPYNCSSSLKLRDDISGNAYSVRGFNLSCVPGLVAVTRLLFLLLLIPSLLTHTMI